jgi:hypothetical protein
VLEHCLALGMNGCLNKPYELPELFDVLSRHYRPEFAPAPTPVPAGGPALMGLGGARARPQLRDQRHRDQPDPLPAPARQVPRPVRRRSGGPAQGRGGAGLGGGGAVVAHPQGPGRPARHERDLDDVRPARGRRQAGDPLRATTALAELENQMRPLVEGLGKVLLPDVGETDPQPALPDQTSPGSV